MTKLNIVNAKAMAVVELYGILDPVTRDWTDGVLSNIFREINKPTDKKEKRYAYVCLCILYWFQLKYFSCCKEVL